MLANSGVCELKQGNFERALVLLEGAHRQYDDQSSPPCRPLLGVLPNLADALCELG